MSLPQQAPSRRSILSLGLSKDVLTALTHRGYETVEDLNSANAEELSKILNIPSEDVQHLITRSQNSQTPTATLPLTQSAAAMVQHAQKMSTKCAALDKMLDGGLSRGQILEISGPPGSPKEKMAIDILTAFALAGDEVIFVDCQNMASPTVLAQSLERYSNTTPALKRRIHYARAHTLPDLVLFMHHLPNLLNSHTKVSLLIINSISFPFQNPSLSISQKNGHLERLKQTLSKVNASHKLTIVTTSQLAIKMVNADGTPGTFDSGARGIMLPSLGSSYLPRANAHRVILAPDGLTSGLIKLLSSPKYPPAKVPRVTEPYLI
ncbi:P-loop containing nucleoside triphosphate hydrolase protein [Flammula alnicola]|nr:P-loop containing nucleoside triphosphate hydrolase protein [Flammula alnicola]